MITFTELRTALGLTQPQLTQLVSEGMPHVVEKGKKLFDEEKVEAWLSKHPRFIVEPSAPAELPDIIYTTRQEVADHFGVSTRTIADWLKKEGFPGRAGGPGQQTGYFPAGKIEAWLTKEDNNTGGSTRSRERVNEARARKLELEIAKELGNLVPLEKYEALAIRACASAKALLDGFPDQVIALLPQDTDDKTRSKVRSKADDLVEKFLATMAQMIEGDEDDEQTD